MKNKLKSQSGETLAETLAGILIAALASALFLSLVMTSMRINEKTEKADAFYYDTLSLLECYDTKPGSDVIQKAEGDVTISVRNSAKAPDGELDSIAVEVFYGNDMASYQKAEPGGGS